MRNSYRVFMCGLSSVVVAIGLCFSVPVRAFTCVAKPASQLLMEADLIFHGIVEAAEPCNNSQTVTHYKIRTLYKGFIEGNTVKIEDGNIFQGCSPSEVGETHYVLAGYNANSDLSYPRFSYMGCSEWQFNDSPTEYLPKLDRYRLSLQKEYKTIDQNTKSIRAWEKVLDLQKNQNDNLGALHALSSLRKLDPKKQDYVIRYADSLASIGKYADALAAYNLALSLGPDNKRIQRGKVRVLIATDRFAETDPRWLDYADLDLGEANFSNRTLVGAIFSRANLHRCNFQKANLQAASFLRAYIHDSDLSGAKMKNADLQFVQADSANLSGVDLSNSNLRRASLYGAQLRNANLTDADLTDASLEKADLTGAQLKGSKLTRVRFIEARIPGADLSGKDLRATQFQGADLRNAKLIGADLRGAYFSGLAVEFRDENPIGRAKMADLRGADLTDAALWGADLTEVLYDCHTKFPRNFSVRKLRLVDSPGCPVSQ